ncbi:MAG: tetratricopeptide repeat protein, partial [Pirellulaceae bacterium]|nr:tetratricopeptide repeat protein [Pirellulaceae bacterium]
SAFFSLGGWAVLKVRRGERLPPGAAELLAFQAAIVVSCLAHLLVLWQHSGHGFSVLKFSLLLATLPFSLLPVAALLLRDATPLAAGQAAAGQARGWEIRWGAIQGAAAAICLAFLAWNSPRQLSLFGQPYLEPERLKMAFAAAGVEQRDVLVSPDMEIPARPPLALSETMKRVHRAASAGELAKVLAPVRPPFRISTLWAVEGQLRFRFWNVDSTDELAAAQAAAAADLISGESQTGSPPLYLSMDPAVPPSAEALARSLLALREPARAASVLADALTANPKSADLYCLHGIALFQAGRIEPAERQFLRAIELQPQSAEAHFSLGFLRQSERPAQAKADFAEALRIEPGLVEARCGLAAILLAEGALIDAAEQLRLALATNPRHAGALQLRQKLDALTRPSSSR